MNAGTPFRTKILVRFNHADITRVMFEGHFVTYAHQTLERFVREAGIEWRSWFVDPAHRVMFSRLDLRAHRSLPPGREVEITLRVRDIGETAFSSHYAFVTVDGDVACTIDAENAFVDREAGTPVRIPEAIRAGLERVRVADEGAA